MSGERRREIIRDNLDCENLNISVKEHVEGYEEVVESIKESEKEKGQERQHIDCKKFLQWLFAKKPEDEWIEVSKLYESKGVKTVNEALEIAREWDYSEIFFGVQPRFRFSGAKGRARREDIDTCVAFFLDFDFKKEIPLSEVPEDIKAKLDKKGYVEQDEVLWIKDGDKFVKIEKSTYEHFVQLIEPKLKELGLDLDYVSVIDSGNGFHCYMRLQRPVKPQSWIKVQEMLIKHFNADEKCKDPSRLMRLPDSWNLKFKNVGLRKFCKVLKLAEKDVEFSKIRDRLKILIKEKEEKEVRREEIVKKEFNEDEIEKKAEALVEILRPYYRVEHRHNIILGLSGALRKAGWKLEDAEKLITVICKAFNDEELESNRLVALRLTFEKESKDVSYKPLINEITKIVRDELNYSEEEAKDVAQEVFERIAKVIGFDTKYVRIPIEAIPDKDEQRCYIWFINGESVGIKLYNEFSGREIYISDYYIDSVTEYKVLKFATGESETRYTIVFRNRFDGEEKRYEFMKLNDIIEKAKEEEIPKSSRYFSDAVRAIIQKFRELKKVKKVVTADAVGFFEHEDKIKWFNPPKTEISINLPERYSGKDVEEALNILTEIIKFYDERPEIKAIIASGFIAPFSFIRKQHNIEQKYKVLYGFQHTGKTWICKCIASIWGDTRYNLKKSGRSSIPQIGDFIGSTSLLLYFDEARKMLEDEKIIEMLKDATLNLTSREIIIDPRSREKRVFPAYANLYFTMNTLPERARGTEAFIEERCYLFHFDVSMKKPNGKEFWDRISKRLHKLAVIGAFIRDSIEFLESLNEEDRKVLKDKTGLTVGDVKAIILDGYSEEWEAGRRLLYALLMIWNALNPEEKIEIPEWLKEEIQYDYKTVIKEEKVEPLEEWLSWFVRKVNELYVRLTKDDAIAEIETKIKRLKEAGELGWIGFSKDKQYVLITRRCFEEFINDTGFELQTDLKYWKLQFESNGIPAKVEKTRMKMGSEYKSLHCLKVKFDDFIGMLRSEVEEDLDEQEDEELKQVKVEESIEEISGDDSGKSIKLPPKEKREKILEELRKEIRKDRDSKDLRDKLRQKLRENDIDTTNVDEKSKES